jgi:membrane protease YdiL (CAAX protease family)
MTQSRPTNELKPNWKQVALFLGLTFGLTYLLDLFLYLTSGYGANVGTTSLLQAQMLIPAAVAIILQLFVFRDSRIYGLQERPRWFFYVYLAYALIQLALALSLFLMPNQIYQIIASALVQVLLIGLLIFVVLLRLTSGKEAFERAGLSGGKFRYWITFGLLIAGIYAAMTGLNALFGLGQPVDIQEMLAGAAGGQAGELQTIPNWLWLAIVGFQAVIVGPLLGLPIAFGEEYGWRGYLQGELVRLGRVRGILLVGVIWGLWHAPIIAMGHNYPGYPVPGILLMTVYTRELAFIFGYAVLKSGSVWLAAFLHALNNQVIAFLMAAVYRPDDPVFSFGIGIYGLIVLAIVVVGLLVLDRKAWASPAATAADEPVSAESDI